MTTNHSAKTRRHPSTPFRKDAHHMFHIEMRYAEVRERQARFRAEAERERLGRSPRRPFRHRLGRSLVRLGHQVGGDAMTAPAWPG